MILFFASTLCYGQVKWETFIAEETGQAYKYTSRLLVPHGWLVFNFATGLEIPQTVFYPDENHEWIY